MESQRHPQRKQEKSPLASQIQKVKSNMSKWEWVPELDKALQEIVLRNYFNFDMVSLELNDEARRLGLDFGATHVFTNEKCRIRWSYLHLKRQTGQQVKYKMSPMAKQSPTRQEMNQALIKKPQVTEPQQDLEGKSFDSIMSINKDKVNLGNLEAELWKKNITAGPRLNKDYLDVSSEDFTKNTSFSIDGKEITPSNFNIFRDSLRLTSEQLLRTLNENLPEMNLHEIEEEERRRQTDGDVDDDDEEVLPLDFRTALIEEENKVVIQAKPLNLKTEDELMREAALPYNSVRDPEFESMDSYLEAVKKEPFRQEEGNVIMIDPDINIKEKFDQIDLACNKEQRINNTINAPLRTKEQIALAAFAQSIVSHQPKMQAPKITNKQYETDTDNETEQLEENMPHSFKKENLDFNNILKQFGVNDLNRMIGCTSSEDDRKKPKEEDKKAPAGDRTASKRIGLIESIMNENRQAHSAKRMAESMPQSIDVMLKSLGEEITQEVKSKAAEQQSEEDSDVAPMSALVDTPSKEDLKRIELKKAEKSVKLASSASEDEHSATDKRKTVQKRVTFQDIPNAPESETEMIDTSTAPKKKAAKPQTYKGVKVQSDNEEEPAGSGESSKDSAEEYFNQQRKQIKKKLLGSKQMRGEFDKEDYASMGEEEPVSTSYRWGDEEDMSAFDSMMKQNLEEAKRVQEEEQERAREEQDQLRRERLEQQAEVLRKDQEKKQRERDELMEKLKKQDEERKSRKREERARKEAEKEMKRRLEEEKKQREDELREQNEQVELRARQEEDRARKDIEEMQRRKDNFERSIKKIWNGSDIPCLFDPKISYSRQLYSLPVALEDKILNNEVPNEDIVYRRYKVLLIPIEGLFKRTSGLPLIELVNYFLRNSTVPSCNINEDQDQKFFPFKCIGLVQSVAAPPFNKCSLSAVQQNEQTNAQRVLTILFDTHDHPRTKHNFNETIKLVRLTDILSARSMHEISMVYAPFLEKLATDYMQASKIKEFPYNINIRQSPLLVFENQADLMFDGTDTSKESLSRISFFMEYSIQDDTIPMATKESWDFLRRYPTFYAFNPNAKTYSRIDSRGKIITKYDQYQQENVCVIFKEVSIGKVPFQEFTQTTKANDSLSFFLQKAIIKGGLEICGMRMIYMDEEQTALYEQLFNEKLSSSKSESQSLFALFLRGVDAIVKCEQIIGHFNPDIARKTNEKSVRAFFGSDKDQHNCVLKMFASQKKNLSELNFWFGGRVQQQSSTLEILSIKQAQQIPISTMYLVVPPRIEKQFLFLSPLVTTRELPSILQSLCEFGVTILELQKINYERFQYEGEGIHEALNRHLCLFRVRGSSLLIPIGFVLKVSREGLVQKYLSKIGQILQRNLSHLDQKYGGLVYMTQGDKEYKVVRQKLRQNIFNVNFQQLQLDHLKPKEKRQEDRTDYDSEDTENYKEISLFNFDPKPKKKVVLISSSTVKQPADSYETNTFCCFLRMSVFKKQIIRDILEQTLSQQTKFELIGVKIFNAKRDIYNELVPVEVRTLFKKIAFKFYEGHTDLRLRKKITEFKTIVLILRGRNVENNIGKIYDRETLKFINADTFEGLPQAIFLTNQTLLDPLFDFLLNTRMIKMYNDFGLSHEHLMDSPVYSYMLNHNVESPDPTVTEMLTEQNVVSVSNIVLIKSKDQLHDTQDSVNGKLSACVVVVKPNQPLNVALRTLKSIANNKELGLTIQSIEIVRYDERQIELLYRHDIEYDELIPEQVKEAMKNKLFQLFKDAKHPIVQFLVAGPYAISKIKQIIGHRDPKLASKDSMRTFYGVDRVDNAYFVSENFSESLIERDFLFSHDSAITMASFHVLEQSQKKTIKAKNQEVLGSIQLNQASNIVGLTHHQELALILFSPTIVQNGEFIFVLDDIYRSKFNICAILRSSDTLERADLEFLFAEQTPRLFSIDALQNLEFSKEGGCVMIVVEKEKAVQEASELVGRLEIKGKNDFDKYKKKQSSSSSMFSTYEQLALTQEYGPYIFTFPIGGAAANQKKILRYFNALPNSNHFDITYTE